MKIKNIFYLNFLSKALIHLLIDKINKLILSMIVNNEEKCEVKDIFNIRNFQIKI